MYGPGREYGNIKNIGNKKKQRSYKNKFIDRLQFQN